MMTMGRGVFIAAIFILGLLTSGATRALAQSTPSPNSSTDDWQMLNHDLAHTGYSTSTAPINNESLWTFATGGAVTTSPAVVEGLVYVGSDDGSIYALNAASGELVWNYSTGGPVQSSPAVVNGVVYVGGFHSHSVFALNASSGALIWNSPTISVYPNKISSTAVINGLVYVCLCNGGYGGGLRVLNATTGDLIWTYSPKALVYSSPAVNDGKVYFGTDSGRIFALDAVSGNLIWSCGILVNGSISNSASSVPVDCSVSVGDGLVFLGTAGQKVTALNASTGAFVWSGDVKGYVAFTTPVDANGVVYISSAVGGTQTQLKYGGVSALRAETGESLWNVQIGSVMYSSPAIAGDLVIVGSDYQPSPLSVLDGHSVYALHASNGAIAWTYETGAAVYSSPAVAYGVVYVGSNDGKVYAIGTYQGPQLTPQPSGEPSFSPLPSASPNLTPTSPKSESPSLASSPSLTQQPTTEPSQTPDRPKIGDFAPVLIPASIILLSIVAVGLLIYSRRKKRQP